MGAVSCSVENGQCGFEENFPEKFSQTEVPISPKFVGFFLNKLLCSLYFYEIIIYYFLFQL
jgi:hypothetical protein